MRFSSVLLAVSLVQSALSVAITIPDGKRAVAFGDPSVSLNPARSIISRRGEEYDLDRLDDLEEEAEDASKEQVYKGIDYLVNLYNGQGIRYGLMGGVAMQLYGYQDRETKDSDMVVSVNSRDLLDKVKDDDKIARPSGLMAASGTHFRPRRGRHRSNFHLFTGGDQSPPVETHELDGYEVLNIGPLISSKLRRSEDKDKDDILWLIQNKGDDVKAAADSIDKGKRIDFAEEYDDDDDKQEAILEAFKLSRDDIDD